MHHNTNAHPIPWEMENENDSCGSLLYSEQLLLVTEQEKLQVLAWFEKSFEVTSQISAKMAKIANMTMLEWYDHLVYSNTYDS